MAKVTKASLLALLNTIIAFGEVGGYVPASAELTKLVNEGKVQTGPTTDAGVAVRATQAGIDSVKPAAATVEAAKPAFTIATGFVLPESNRGGNKGKSLYPFEQLTVGQSFFIPASTKHPEPWKSLASTASSATRRYAEPVTENGQAVMETVKTKAKAAVGVEGQPGFEPAVPAGQTTRQKMANTRVFKIGKADDGALWGQPGVAGAAVLRTA